MSMPVCVFCVNPFASAQREWHAVSCARFGRPGETCNCAYVPRCVACEGTRYRLGGCWCVTRAEDYEQDLRQLDAMRESDADAYDVLPESDDRQYEWWHARQSEREQTAIDFQRDAQEGWT